MATLQVSGGISINLLQNGDSLNTTLNSTAPLYQTFKKGTTDFVPNWATMPDGKRPVIFPRVYSVMEAKTLVPTDIRWKYNGVALVFGADGVAIAPSPAVAVGKVKQVDYNGAKALKIVGNVASDVNNDSDTISFFGKVTASGQSIDVSTEITLLVEEASNSLYRLFLIMTDDVIDGDETSISMRAALFNNGSRVTSGIEFEFVNIDGTVLRAKNASDTFVITKAMIDSELMVMCKAYMNNAVVAQEQKQVWDSTDPFTIVCDKGTSVRQSALDNVVYGFSLLNARTGSVVPNTAFIIKVYKNATAADITSQFAKTNKSITITGAKITEHQSIYVDAACTINL